MAKRPTKALRRGLVAYEQSFLRRYSDTDPHGILKAETKRSLAVVCGIRDQGRDERNKLKAANTLLDRTLPRIEKLEIDIYRQLSDAELEDRVKSLLAKMSPQDVVLLEHKNEA